MVINKGRLMTIHIKAAPGAGEGSGLFFYGVGRQRMYFIGKDAGRRRWFSVHS